MLVTSRAYIRENERSKINNVNIRLRKLEKEQLKPKVSQRKQIFKIRVEINEMETGKQ